MTCYLIHFDTPYKHAQHYLGYTSRSARARFAEHQTSSDVALIRAARNAGITLRLARIWGKEGRAFETRHKYRVAGQHRHGTKTSLRRLCPICQKAAKSVKSAKSAKSGKGARRAGKERKP